MPASGQGRERLVEEHGLPILQRGTAPLSTSTATIQDARQQTAQRITLPPDFVANINLILTRENAILFPPNGQAASSWGSEIIIKFQRSVGLIDIDNNPLSDNIKPGVIGPKEQSLAKAHAEIYQIETGRLRVIGEDQNGKLITESLPGRRRGTLSPEAQEILTKLSNDTAQKLCIPDFETMIYRQQIQNIQTHEDSVKVFGKNFNLKNSFGMTGRYTVQYLKSVVAEDNDKTIPVMQPLQNEKFEEIGSILTTEKAKRIEAQRSKEAALKKKDKDDHKATVSPSTVDPEKFFRSKVWDFCEYLKSSEGRWVRTGSHIARYDQKMEAIEIIKPQRTGEHFSLWYKIGDGREYLFATKTYKNDGINTRNFKYLNSVKTYNNYSMSSNFLESFYLWAEDQGYALPGRD